MYTGDVIYIEANSGSVKRVGRSDIYASEYDLEADEFVPVPKGVYIYIFMYMLCMCVYLRYLCDHVLTYTYIPAYQRIMCILEYNVYYAPMYNIQHTTMCTILYTIQAMCIRRRR